MYCCILTCFNFKGVNSNYCIDHQIATTNKLEFFSNENKFDLGETCLTLFISWSLIILNMVRKL